MYANDLILLFVLTIGTIYINWNIISKDLFRRIPQNKPGTTSASPPTETPEKISAHY